MNIMAGRFNTVAAAEVARQAKCVRCHSPVNGSTAIVWGTEHYPSPLKPGDPLCVSCDRDRAAAGIKMPRFRVTVVVTYEVEAASEEDACQIIAETADRDTLFLTGVEDRYAEEVTR